MRFCRQPQIIVASTVARQPNPEPTESASGRGGVAISSADRIDLGRHRTYAFPAGRPADRSSSTRNCRARRQAPAALIKTLSRRNTPRQKHRGQRTYFVVCDAHSCHRRGLVAGAFSASLTVRHQRSPRCGSFRSSRSPILGVDSSTPRTIANAVTRSNGSCQRCIARSNVPL